MMGDKLSAKQMALECGVPTTPGTAEPLKDRAEAQKLAVEFGFPVILKAAAGGGGRGMRRCDTVEDVGVNFDLVKAKTEFGIEVRVFTAQTGMTVKELAEKAGVKYTTLVETTTGRCAGHQLIPTVRRFMATYPQTEAGAVR